MKIPRSKPCRVSVLGSGTVRTGSSVYRQAVKLGLALAQAGFSVCHGGYGGVMEAVAKGCRAGGGTNTGVIIKRKSGDSHFCGKNDCPRLWVDRKIVMSSWEKRLLKLIEIGDAYVFLDGATGTLNELFFVWEMANKKLHTKPIILLGQRLHDFVKFLKKDPSLKVPANFYLSSSIVQTVRLLKEKALSVRR